MVSKWRLQSKMASSGPTGETGSQRSGSASQSRGRTEGDLALARILLSRGGPDLIDFQLPKPLAWGRRELNEAFTTGEEPIR